MSTATPIVCVNVNVPPGVSMYEVEDAIKYAVEALGYDVMFGGAYDHRPIVDSDGHTLLCESDGEEWPCPLQRFIAEQAVEVTDP